MRNMDVSEHDEQHAVEESQHDVEDTPRLWAMPALLAVILAVTGWEFVRFGLSPTVSELGRAGGMSVGAMLRDEWWSIAAANFLHGGVPHLVMNCFVILLLASVLERAYGGLVVICTALIACLGASVGALFIDNGAVTIGASGIGFALMGCAFAADPRARTPVGHVARQLLPVNLVITFVAAGAISVGGHLGGLVAGIVSGLVLVGGSTARPRAAMMTFTIGAAIMLAVVCTLPGISLNTVRDVQERVGPRLVERQVASRIRSNDHLIESGPTCHMLNGSVQDWSCAAMIDGSSDRVALSFDSPDDQFTVTDES